SGKSPVRTGAWHPNLAPYQPFSASDGEVVIAVGNNNQFARFCNFISKPELSSDERFATNPARNRNREALESEIQAEIGKKPRAYWLENLPLQGVPCSPINTIEQAFDEPQVKARGMKIDLPHTTAGTAPGIANPLNFSDTKIEYTHAPPLLGQHTDEVLREVLGRTDEEIQVLHERNLV
ncbi:MAG: CoA transferase, partial [Hyphomicrobiales bacterium]